MAAELNGKIPNSSYCWEEISPRLGWVSILSDVERVIQAYGRHSDMAFVSGMQATLVNAGEF